MAKIQKTSAEKTAEFGEKKILPLMAQYSLPAIVAMLIQSAFNVINLSFVGRAAGHLGLAAIAISGPINMIQGAINQLIGNGCAAAVSIKLGQGDQEGARDLFGSALTFQLLIAAFNITLCQIFLPSLLRAFGASEAVSPYAQAYMRILLIGTFFGCFMSMNPMLRIEGYPMKAMITQLISVVVSLILSPTLIFGFKLGIRGAALSTASAQFATAVWVLAFFLNKNRMVGLRRRYVRVKVSHVIQTMRFGLPSFIMSFTQSVFSTVMNRSLVAYGGDIAVSSWGVINNVAMLISQPVFGLNQGAQPLIGYNIGAKNYARVRQLLRWALLLATSYTTLGWLVTRFVPRQLIAFYNPNPELVAMGARMMIAYQALLFVSGFQSAGASFFQYSGRPRISIMLSFSRQALLLLPMIIILPRFFGFTGILMAGPIADGIAAAITAAFIIREFRRLRNLERETAAASGKAI